ncbi:hypothetical protein QQX98_004072 [Neonectria punicea]|uniref:Uncharacterized protein n=1 Tax=Neonectria punicea TaxID=979145 RepID=A0ABR1HAV0_9HYPO
MSAADRAHLAAMGLLTPDTSIPDEPVSEKLADRAEALTIPVMQATDPAAYRAVRHNENQAKEHTSLLGQKIWEYGYRTFASRQTHEGHAEASRQDTIEWVEVSAALRAAVQAEQEKVRSLRLSKDLELLIPRI